LVNQFLTPAIILLSITLGFVFPSVGLIWKPYLAFLLMLLMFFVTLGLEPEQITKSLRAYPVIGVGMSTVFVLLPLLSLFARPFFSPIIVAGILLAFSCPSAVATAFWVNVFKGDAATGLVISTIANLISVLTIPTTMLLAMGTVITVDVVGMMIDLAEIVLIPMTASLLLKKFLRINWKKITGYGFRIQLALLALLIWGSISPGVAYAKSNVSEFLLLNVFIFAVLAFAFGTAYALGKRFGYEQAIAIALATSVKNAALSLVIGLVAFGSPILPPLIANLVAQNLLLIPARFIFKDKIAGN
jgi:BASS family bile acid:Na+ symporter